MSIIKRMRKQWAMYFPIERIDRYGKPVHSKEPIEIKCRWDEVSEEFVNEQGQTVLSAAKVYPDRILEKGGLLWQGTAVEFALVPWNKNTTPPSDLDDVYPIRQFQRIPNLKAKEFLLIAVL